MIIYVIEGQYSDDDGSWRWTVCAYRDREQADEYAKRLTELAKILDAEYDARNVKGLTYDDREALRMEIWAKHPDSGFEMSLGRNYEASVKEISLI